MIMRFRSLEGRIATLFLVLILIVQCAGLLVIQDGIESNARTSIASELVNGEKVFRNLLEQNGQKVRNQTQAQARDTAFVQAIGTDDSVEGSTIASALSSFGGRAGAALTMLVSADRKVRVRADIPQAAQLEGLVLGMLDQAERSGGTNAIAVIANKPFQIVVVPVKAPITIAWVVMGFPVNRQLANNMKDLSGLDVALLTRSGEGSWQALDTTFPAPALANVVHHLQTLKGPQAAPFELTIQDSKYSAKLTLIGSDNNAAVMLARSIDEATAEYTKLERKLILLTIVGTMFAALASVLTAKRIAQPLRLLVDTAGRLERGDYLGQIEFKRADEIGALATAFDSMRDGIAKREHEISRLAYWDTLTNLPNRAQFVRLLEESIEAAKGQQQSVFVLMMDLDRFKHVNDVMGHNFGDALLRKVAERLQSQVGEAHSGGHVARLGGDEFVVLLPSTTLERAYTVAGAILHALEQPLSLEDQTVDIGAGLGIAGYPLHAEDAESLLSMAEVAMYTAKQRNDGAVVYDSVIDKSSAKSLSLLTELRNAIERNEFRLHVQPKLCLKTGTVVGIESLVRWVHPERGNVFPDEFIPFAEQTGFIRVLTRWVLDQSAALCHELIENGIKIKCSVNLSTRDLMDQDLPNKFNELLQRHKLSPASFCLEITESAIMDDPVRAEQTLHRLHAMGVDLSIDDFGTGYSSLAYLKRLPVNELKIDKSFVLNMEKDVGDTKIVRSTIDLGHNMGLRVVAEGIETEGVWNLLAGMGCDQGQGYFMSRPIPGDQLINWIKNWKAPEAKAA
jgi:diguanylate cyclase (GGDEF)-like protein